MDDYSDVTISGALVQHLMDVLEWAYLRTGSTESTARLEILRSTMELDRATQGDRA